MATRIRKAQSLGRVWVVTFAAFLAASSALAISIAGKGDDVRMRDRLVRMRIMDILVLNYGVTNWYAVTSSLAAHPEDPGNPAVMSLFLSIGNVHLNQFERDGDQAHLDRALLFFEWVVANRNYWGGRDGTGSVVSYLDVSVQRLQKECDVGADGIRIDVLANMAMAITAEEADAALAAESSESLSPIAAGDASRVTLLAAAANFLKDDARAATWGQSASAMAAGLGTSGCQTLAGEVDLSLGALSYRLARQPVPDGFSDVTFYGVFRPPSTCPTVMNGYATASPVSAVTLGDSLDLAIHDGQVLAIYLEEYLWLYPPGSWCSLIDDPGDTPIDKNR